MLYAANLFEMAKPVNKPEPTEPVKKVRQRKIKTPPSPSTTNSSVSAPPNDPIPQPAAAPKKRGVKRNAEGEVKKEDVVVMDVKEARKRKREATKAALEEEKKALEERLAEAERKQIEEKEAKKKKAEERKEQRKKKAEVKAMEKEFEKAYADVVAKEEPPAWFKKYVGSVKNEENAMGEKKPKKVVKEEVHQVAEQTWNDGVTRERVKQEVDNHMSRMYSQIFGARRKV
jgi:hypothetical protein